MLLRRRSHSGWYVLDFQFPGISSDFDYGRYVSLHGNIRIEKAHTQEPPAHGSHRPAMFNVEKATRDTPTPVPWPSQVGVKNGINPLIKTKCQLTTRPSVSYVPTVLIARLYEGKTGRRNSGQEERGTEREQQSGRNGEERASSGNIRGVVILLDALLARVAAWGVTVVVAVVGTIATTIATTAATTAAATVAIAATAAAAVVGATAAASSARLTAVIAGNGSSQGLVVLQGAGLVGLGATGRMLSARAGLRMRGNEGKELTFR